MITKFLGQNISTKNPGELAAFYQNLGIKVFRTFGESYDGSRIANSEDEPCVFIWDSTKWGNSTGGYVHLVFKVDDIHKTYEELLQKGISLNPPEKQSWGEYELHLKDPDGNVLALMERM